MRTMGVHNRIIHFGGFILVFLLILSISPTQGVVNTQINADGVLYVQPQEEEEGTVDQIKSPDFTNPNSEYKASRSKGYFTDKSSKLVDFEIRKNYITDEFIDINSNYDFETLGFPGSGTVFNPYIIEGFSLNGFSVNTSSISIRDTTSYFEIRDNYLSSAGYGIVLNNSANGFIYNNTIITVSEAIYLESSDNNTIASNTISNTFDGINLKSSDYNIILSNVISNTTRAGIYFRNSSNNTIITNTITNSEHGIFFTRDSGNNLISSNLISNHTISGFQLQRSRYNIIEDNVFENSGLEFVFGSRQTMVENNTVNGYPLIFLQDANNYAIAGDVGQIILINSTNIRIENKNIRKTSSGIQLYFSSNNTITSNTIANNSFDGIYLFYSSNNNIITNVISNNTEMGIRNGASSNNTLSSNIITSNLGNGIFLEKYVIFDTFTSIPPLNNNITSNVISNNTGAGIKLSWDAENNFISSNLISNNFDDGIYLRSSNSNTITSNTISNNLNRGIYFSVSGYNTVMLNNITNNFGYGIYLRYIGSDNNTIKYNNFIDNGVSSSSQAYDHVYPDNFKFNYWNDQTNPDIDNNEVVDDPYVIDGFAGNFDSYPLMIPIGQGVQSPYITNPADVIYIEGSQENMIVWDVFDINPGEYYVTLDGEMYIEINSWVSGEIEVDIDGFALGSYTFTVYVFNINGNQRSDTVLVTVTEIPLSTTSTNSLNTGSTELTNTGNTVSTTTLDQSPFLFALLFPTLIIQYFRRKSKVNRTICLKVT